MKREKLQDVFSHGEWLGICDKWRKPEKKPAIKLTQTIVDGLNLQNVFHYSKNTNESLRDFGIIKGKSSTTPDFDHDYWVSGMNDFLK